jgi:olefin beta-lactone synthetase
MKALSALRQWAHEFPHETAIVDGERRITWESLAGSTWQYARGLQRRGILPGDRVAILVPPGDAMLAVTYGCLAIGAVPVFLDPGLGLWRLMHLLKKSGAVAFIGSPLAQAVRSLIRIPSLRVVVCTTCWPGAISLRSLAVSSDADPVVTIVGEAPGLVLYTSGATGASKGITVSRATLDAQVQALSALAELTHQSVLLAVLPAMALIGPAAGCTTRIPRGPLQLAEDLALSTHSFGSPAVWGPLADSLESRGVTLPQVRCLLFGGCAIDPALIRRWQALTPNAQLASVYGATEGVPLSWANAQDLLTKVGQGTLIGRPGPGVEFACDASSAQASFGALRVRGSVVASDSWIEIGDLAQRDATGDWWFMGRVSERVEAFGSIWPSVPTEARFRHDLVRQVALVGIGERPQQTPVLVIEPRQWPRTRRAATALIDATLAAGGSHTQELALTRTRVLLRRRIPVDPRHRAKILRNALSVWAAKRISAEPAS